jgi:hypothetical protein
MKDKLRKKAQRKINKKVRLLNKGLRTDNLWRGRFYCHQLDAAWERFDDNSGGYLNVLLEMRDLKTGLFYQFVIDNYDNGWRLFKAANKFIVEFSGVWKNIDEVKQDKTDWTKVQWEKKKSVYS